LHLLQITFPRSAISPNAGGIICYPILIVRWHPGQLNKDWNITQFISRHTLSSLSASTVRGFLRYDVKTENRKKRLTLQRSPSPAHIAILVWHCHCDVGIYTVTNDCIKWQTVSPQYHPLRFSGYFSHDIGLAECSEGLCPRGKPSGTIGTCRMPFLSPTVQ